MAANYSHDKLTSFFVFFLLASLLHVGCSSDRPQTFSAQHPVSVAASRGAVNINTATADQLQSIPGIGPVLSKKIIEHRDRYGPFRRAEEILIVEGISEKRFREFRSYILIE
jgi:competence protein ComEA